MLLPNQSPAERKAIALKILKSNRSPSGFALIATISVMVLLIMVALAMLSLSSIEIRSSRQGDNQAVAKANARMALMIAIGELQKSLGPDQRISADASILDSSPDTASIDGVSQPNLLGVWKSWSPELASDPLRGAPDYDKEKIDRFQRWLISNPDPVSLEDRAYALSTPGSIDVERLYSKDKHGFDLEAPLISTGGQGALAWHVRQENTRAKVTTQAYPKNGMTLQNSDLVAPAQTGYMLNDNFKDAGDKLSSMAAKVTTDGQLILATDLTSPSYDPAQVQPHFTVHSKGLQTDVVKGGFKKDLSLAFELDETSFNSAFNGSLTPHSNYDGQVPLYEPIVNSQEQSCRDNYQGLMVDYTFRLGGVPTYDTLRSHHRLYRHLYKKDGHTTAYQRQSSNISWNTRAGTQAGLKSETGLMPIMDRVLYYFSVDISSGGIPRLIITPVVILWNPYNVALDCEGFDIYPWADFPYQMDWLVQKADGSDYRKTNWISTFLTDGSNGGEGKIVNPYFHLALTHDGAGVNPSESIHFSPGEVMIFTVADPTPVEFDRLAPDASPGRRITMRPSKNGGFNGSGGFAVVTNRSLQPSNNFTYSIKSGDKRLVLRMSYIQTYPRPYHVTMEDLSRLQGGGVPNKISEVQIMDASSLSGGQNAVNLLVTNPINLRDSPRTISVQETYHRTATAGGGKQASDLFYTVNARQPDLTLVLFGSNTAGTGFKSAPHYVSQQFATREIPGAVLPTLDGTTGHYGLTNSTLSGERYLPAFEIPQEAPMSLSSLAHADLANTTYSPSHQIGNSMATPFLDRDSTARAVTVGPGRAGDLTLSPSPGFPIYDHSYLLNEALWDSCFYSSAAPVTKPSSSSGGLSSYIGTTAQIVNPLKNVIDQFVATPSEHPLRNRRHHLYTGTDSAETVIERLNSDDGFLFMAAHLLVDGAFNINSTDVEAWAAMLASARGAEFKAGQLPSGETDVMSQDKTALPRMHHPVGSENDLWQGFRTIDDAAIRNLAEGIVEEVKERGPFLSLGEFVNRRIEKSGAGLAGAIQTAINRAGLNNDTKYETVQADNYPYKDSYMENSTGVGTPGYLSQADVLNQLGNFITPRSDTFVIRTYGDAQDRNGRVLARAYCEAVVQRLPELTDTTQTSSIAPSGWNDTNKRFGRKFMIVSFRYLSPSEVQ